LLSAGEHSMRGLSAAPMTTVPSGVSSECRAMRVNSTKGKPDLKTTAKTV
jgi:hypothetical protein